MDRRRFLRGAVAGAVWGAALPASLHASQRKGSQPLSSDVLALLEKSDFVYVSPLKRSGDESRCHGEVWFDWQDDSVVLITAADRWKARSLEAGLDRARLWVGNHGRWKGLISNNERFRKAPSFDARAEAFQDEKVLDRMLTSFRKKYPAEIDRWEPRMRKGHADGSRVLIRYRPLG